MLKSVKAVRLAAIVLALVLAASAHRDTGSTPVASAAKLWYSVYLPAAYRDAAGPASTPTPVPTGNSTLHYGVLDQAGLIGDSTGFTNWIASVRAYGMNDGFVYNDNPVLSVSDSLGFNVLTSPMYQMYRQWYYYEQNNNGQPLCGETLSLSCAEAQIGPIVDALRGHTSLVGYDTIDDANESLKERIWYANYVFREHDIAHPEGPTVPDGWPGVLDYSQPDVFITYDYPAVQGYTACDFYHGSNQDWVDRLRFTEQRRSPNAQLIEILQTHYTTNLLRYPTVEELRLNYWLALGEGTKGLYWFTWSTDPYLADKVPWLGLRDNTTLLPEAADLVRRTNILSPTLASLAKIADTFQSSGYVSTLRGSSGAIYLIAANQACTAQNITISSGYYSAQIKDLETGQIYPLPASIPFRGGDGHLYQVLNSVPRTPPTPQTNMALNGSFEQGSTWPANWGAPLNCSSCPVGTVTWYNTVAHSGTHSVKIVGPANGAYFNQNLALKANTRYYLSYWVKGQNFADNWIGIRPVESAQTCCPPIVNAWWNQVGNFDWQRHTVFFRTPADNSQNRLDIVWSLQSGATAWIDDVTLCDVSLPCPDAYLPLPTNTPPPTSTPLPTPTATVAPSVSGVPSYSIDYSLDVETWWANHPYNPDNPRSIPIGGITSPSNVVDVEAQFGGNIQNAINSLPTTGGTLYFAPGSYQHGGFSVLGKSNVHFVADSPGTVTIVGGFNGVSGVSAPANITSDSLSVDYGSFINCLTYSTVPSHQSCLGIAKNPQRNIYFKNITFDGGGTAYYALWLHAIKDVLFDNVTFQNFLDGGANVGPDIAQVSANALSDYIWFRNCQFLGNQRWNLTLDGNHGSGVVNSIFSNSGTGALLFMTNSDYDLDYNQDATFEMNEERNSQYVVLYGNIFNPTNIAIRPGGTMNSLFKNNHIATTNNYRTPNALDLTNPTSFRPGSQYNYFGNRVVGNTADILWQFMTYDQCNETVCPPIGQYQVRGNTIRDEANWFIQNATDVTGPNCVFNNQVNGSPYPNSGTCPPLTPPPTEPVNLVAAATSANQINLSWTASTDSVGVAGYDIYRNNIKVATVTTPSYKDTQLTTSTTYAYFVQAVGTDGNYSTLLMPP